MIKSPGFYCSDDITSIAAMLTVQNVFIQPSVYKEKKRAIEMKKKFSVEEGDHLTLLNVFRAFTRENRTPKWSRSHFLNHKALQRAVVVKKFLLKYMKKFKLDMHTCEIDSVMIRKAIVSGFFAHAAKAQPDGSYKSIKEGTVSDYL
jgi:ATP-dependent RNA helicase DDX35